MVYCTLGHISKNSIKYNAVSKQYSVLFSNLKVGREPGKVGLIYFDEKVVRMSGKYCVEIDMCQETYKMYVFNSGHREVIDVPLESIVKSHYNYFKKHQYIFVVAQKAVKESNKPDCKKIIFDLPIQFWGISKSKNCLVEIFNNQFIVQNYKRVAVMTFGEKTSDVEVKLSIQLKDGSWKEQTMSAGRFWYTVDAAKKKKKENKMY